MKRAKRLYGLLGVLAVLCVGTFAVSKYEETKEKIKNSDEVILSLDPEKVTKLSWEYEDVSLGFYKNETWVYEEDEAFPVDGEKIENLLSVFQEFGAAFVIEDVEDYSAYGLDDPECTIAIETADQSYEVILGDFSMMDSQRYVSLGDGNAYLVSKDPMEAYEVTLKDMILDDTLPEFDTVKSLKFSGAEDYTLTYTEESKASYCAEDVYFTQHNGRTVPADTDKVEAYLDSISSLNLSTYVSYHVTEKELESFGLNDPELTVTVVYESEEEESEQTLTLTIGRNPEEAAKAEESEDTETENVTAYVRIGDSKIIYQLDSTDYQSLTAASYNELRHQQVLTADFAEVTGMDISLDGETYHITSKEEEEERTYLYGEEELDIYNLKIALNTMYAEEFTEETSEQKAEISVTLYLENEEFPEIRLIFYRYDGENCLAVVDGETVCKVSRSDVVDVIEAVHAIVLN